MENGKILGLFSVFNTLQSVGIDFSKMLIREPIAPITKHKAEVKAVSISEDILEDKEKVGRKGSA